MREFAEAQLAGLGFRPPPTSVSNDASADSSDSEVIKLISNKIRMKFLRGCGVIEIRAKCFELEKRVGKRFCPVGRY